MTSINSTSPTSIWVQSQTATSENFQPTKKAEVSTTLLSPTDSVQISEAALAKLQTEAGTNVSDSDSISDVPAENDSPNPPPATTMGNGNGNEPPFPPKSDD